MNACSSARALIATDAGAHAIVVLTRSQLLRFTATLSRPARDVHLPFGVDICDVLLAKRDEIARRFVARARESGAAEALPDEQVIDSLRQFLEELARRIRDEQRTGIGDAQPMQPALSHGEQRFELGYDMGALVREYAALRELLWDVLVEESATVPLEQLRLLFKYLVSGLADAAVQYGASRDAELRRRTAEHISFLAHELRNPLGSAHLALRLIETSGESAPPAGALTALGRALSQMGHLVDDALMSVRLKELGQLVRMPVDVEQLMIELETESALDAEAKGVALRFEGGGRVEGDQRALRSALSNLVRNAVKFTPAGGDVHVRARSHGGRVIIEVEDSCGGLPPGSVQKIFDPFVQVGADRSGFGLGLAIAKQAAAAHDGDLRVHDLPGKGCVFLLDLPERPTNP